MKALAIGLGIFSAFAIIGIIADPGVPEEDFWGLAYAVAVLILTINVVRKLTNEAVESINE